MRALALGLLKEKLENQKAPSGFFVKRWHGEWIDDF